MIRCITIGSLSPRRATGSIMHLIFQRCHFCGQVRGQLLKFPCVRQIDFFKSGSAFRPKRTFGGSLLKGNPRERRPLSTQNPIHLVLKSRLAIGERSMLRRTHSRAIEDLVRRQARQHGLRLYHYVNVGNHLHIVVRSKDRRGFQNFVRSISGVIARIVTERERGPAQPLRTDHEKRKSRLGFWDARPFTRIVTWGRDYLTVSAYIARNQMTALGFSTAATRDYLTFAKTRSSA